MPKLLNTTVKVKKDLFKQLVFIYVFFDRALHMLIIFVCRMEDIHI